MPLLRRADWAFLIVCGVAATIVATLWGLGALAGQAAPDTASYLGTTAAEQPWGEMRHPLYGAFAEWLGASGEATGYVAIAQAGLHVFAGLTLYIAARLGGLRAISAALLSMAALLSQSGLFHLRLLVPESPAISVLLLAFAGVLAASRSRGAYWLLLIPVTLAVGIAYLLRPTFLPAIIALPLLWLIFARRNGQGRCVARAGLLLVVLTLPFVVQSGIRLRAVNDFNIVSFGGYQMSGLAGLMLTPETLARLPSDVQPTAQAILDLRHAAEAAGRVQPTPRNSAGERSFVSAALGYFDIYARTYDDLLGEIVNLRQPHETWVAFNKRLMAFSVATVSASPLQWTAWVAGATARLAGRSIVTNAMALISMIAFCVLAVPATLRRSGLGPSGSDIAPVFLVALAWLAATSPLIVLVTFPATRYIDTGAVLLPAVPAVLAAALIEGLWFGRPAGGTSGAA
jgi:hypothetical protein